GLHQADTVRLAFGPRGEFRGTVSSDERLIAGHWIQPAGPVSFQPRATPTQLRQVSPRVWTGQVNPLEERYRLFLFINGTTGVLGIPENNRWGNQRLVVEGTGDDVTVKGPELHGRYDAATDRLVLTVFRDHAVAFARHTARDALGFYPRVPWPASYTYRRP